MNTPYRQLRFVDMSAQTVRVLMKRSTAVRALVKTSSVQRLVKAARRRETVRPSLRYFFDEILAVGRVRTYKLRDGGLAVTLRAGTRDTDILEEVFYRGLYAFPPSVLRRLDASKSIEALDLGSNIGLFALFLFSRYGSARVVSYEPDPGNLALLGANITSNALADRWQVRAACISNRAGSVRFRFGQFADSAVVQDGHGADVACDDIFALSDTFTLIKMDIEGSEWDILFDPRLSALPTDVLVLEWHADGCPVADAHAAAVERLHAAGFNTLDVPREHSETDGMLWALR